ncbi:MAG: hypothetical protein HC819_19180 [Cyclobacteriaceae bacterium]|nr:hypothetical protein [Cyclobacteriaceae bacterium]
MHCLRGNHEQYLLDGLKASLDKEAFDARGGKETLESFGVKSIDKIPQKYLEFIQALPFFIELEKYLLVHAGLDFALDDPYADNFSMLNIREMQIDMDKTGGRSIVHGHVPTPVAEIVAAVKKHSSDICVDAGCVYTDREGMGHLVALDLETGELYLQENIE